MVALVIKPSLNAPSPVNAGDAQLRVYTALLRTLKHWLGQGAANIIKSLRIVFKKNTRVRACK
jgi:hypothetical protein